MAASKLSWIAILVYALVGCAGVKTECRVSYSHGDTSGGETRAEFLVAGK